MILLISDTPVAGTVPRLAKWMGRLTNAPCNALVRRNYPHHAFELPQGTFGSLPNWERHVARAVKDATTVVVHNVCEPNLLDLVFSAKKVASKVIYQYHSPPLEPPHYDYSIIRRHKFDAILAVSQGHGRFIENSIPVPNIVPDFVPPFSVERERLIFAPHMRATSFRWSNKFSAEDRQVLTQVIKRKAGYAFSDVKIAFGKEMVAHSEIQLYLNTIALLVDDINTGLFHQSAIEGLKSGCAVSSGADLHSIEEYCTAMDAPPPPFIFTHGIDELSDFVSSRSFEREIRNYSSVGREYAARFLGEERIAQRYMSILRNHDLVE